MKNFILRYTLSKFSVIVLLLTAIRLWGWYLPGLSESEALGREQLSGCEVLAIGSVDGIEEKENVYHQKQTIISLHSVTFCNKSFPGEKNLKQTVKSGQRSVVGILCYLEEEEKVPCYGQRIAVRGTAEFFSDSRNPGSFDAAFYYQTKGIAFYLTDARITGRGKEYDSLRQHLHMLRTRLSWKLTEICGEDAGVMQSLLLGDKTLLSEEIKELYQSGGISHILAISGLHISFLGIGLYRLLRRLWLPKPPSAILSAVGLVFYVWMTGAASSACRAGLMFLLFLTADVTGHSYDRRTALACAALLQVLQNPLLLCQSGFWLSYGAVFGLEIVQPFLLDLWKSRVYRLFVPGISISLVTLPILLVSYYEFPLYSFGLNLMIIPLMSVVMGLGLLSLAAGFLWLPFGRALFYPVHIILQGFTLGCDICGKMPGNQWIVGKPPVWRVLLYAALVLFFCLLGRYMAKVGIFLFFAGAVWILTSISPLCGSATFLDVGQGDGIVIRSKYGSAVMIDGGSSSENRLAKYTLLPYLKSQGLTCLDYVFLTHMDEDHINGIRELLEMRESERGKIKTLILPKLSVTDEAYAEMVRLAEQSGVRVCIMQAGDCLRVRDMTFYCLHPQPDTLYTDKNAASMVLYLEMGGLTSLFMGDVDGEAERQFAAEYPECLTRVDLLKAGHHGSAKACSEEFLKKLKPRYTIISCGEHNRYGHPDIQTLERLQEQGTKTLITAKCGAVTAKAGRKDIKMKGWLASW